jgi:hypothetical protein
MLNEILIPISSEWNLGDRVLTDIIANIRSYQSRTGY